MTGRKTTYEAWEAKQERLYALRWRAETSALYHGLLCEYAEREGLTDSLIVQERIADAKAAVKIAIQRYREARKPYGEG